MSSSGHLPPRIRFGVFEVDVRSGELLKDGEKIPLQGQPFALLSMLLEHPGELVTREELRQRIWPEETFVDFDLALNTAVKKVRAAVGDSAEKPQFIETLPKRGYRFIGRLDPAIVAAPRVDSRHPSTRGRLTIGILAVALLVTIGAIIGVVQNRRRSPLSRHNVYIVVVPFENLSPDPNQEYLAAGITEVLTADLAKISSLRVISGKEPLAWLLPPEQRARTGAPAIAKAANVDAVLQGSVARAGNRIRITARLLEFGTGKHLWAETYERDPRDLLLLEGQLAQTIAETVRVALTPREQARLTAAVRAPEVQEAYLKGTFYTGQLTCGAFNRATDEFRYAIARDSQFAAAYAALADVYFLSGDWGCFPQTEVWPKAKALAQKALELDEGDGNVHGTVANIAFRYDWDWDTADREYKRAIELDPAVGADYPLFLFTMHRRTKAFAEIDRERELHPLDQGTNVQLAYLLYLDRQYDKAIEQFLRTIEMYPNSEVAHKWLSIAYEQKGNYDAAFKAILKLLEIVGELNSEEFSRLRNAYSKRGLKGFYEKNVEIAKEDAKRTGVPFSDCVDVETENYIRLGDKQKALYCLEEEYRTRTLEIDRLNCDAQFDPVRTDPHFQDILRRVGLPE